jgi:hypothetical protein
VAALVGVCPSSHCAPPPPKAPEVATAGDEPAGPSQAMCDLLHAYQRPLHLTTAKSSVADGPTRHLRFDLFRPRFGEHDFLAEHVRRSLVLLERRYEVRQALATSNPTDEEDIAAIDHFTASMPAPPSKILLVGIPIAVVAVSQVLLLAVGAIARTLTPKTALISPFFFGGGLTQAAQRRTQLVAAFLNLGDLNTTNVPQVLKTVFASDLVTLLSAAAILAASLYLVGRPFSFGFTTYRIVVGGVARRESSPFLRAAAACDVHRCEQAAFGQLNIVRQLLPPVDLWVKIDLAVTLTLAGFAVGFSYVSGHATLLAGPTSGLPLGSGPYLSAAFDQHSRRDGIVAGALILVALGRLILLTREARRRRRPSADALVFRSGFTIPTRSRLTGFEAVILAALLVFGAFLVVPIATRDRTAPRCPALFE